MRYFGHMAVIGLLLLASACARAPQNDGVTTGSVAASNNGQNATSAFAQSAPESTVTAVPSGPARLRIALLAPLKGDGGEATGLMLERAARLAMRDASAPFELDVIDTGVGAGGALAAAKQGLDAGAKLIVGPIYGADVAAASAATLPAGVPMLAFTSDTSRARGGVYTNAFTPQADVQAILRHATGLGSRHVVVFAPEGRYGDLVLKTARRTLNAAGGQIAFTVRTDGSAEGYRRAAHAAAIAVEGADTIYIPEGGKAPRAIMGELVKAGAALGAKRILGSGQWASADLADARLDGALYAANDERSFKAFAYRYEAIHAKKPSVLAGLAYDAVAVAVALSRRSPGQPFSRAAIESPAGFNGATGLFRFRADGSVERSLAIREVRDGKSEQMKAAAKRFENGNLTGVAALRR